MQGVTKPFRLTLKSPAIVERVLRYLVESIIPATLDKDIPREEEMINLYQSILMTSMEDQRVDWDKELPLWTQALTVVTFLQYHGEYIGKLQTWDNAWYQTFKGYRDRGITSSPLEAIELAQRQQVAAPALNLAAHILEAGYQDRRYQWPQGYIRVVGSVETRLVYCEMTRLYVQYVEDRSLPENQYMLGGHTWDVAGNIASAARAAFDTSVWVEEYIQSLR